MYTYKHPHPAVTADCIVIAQGQVLLVERKNQPCQGEWAFPGGFMEIDETAADAARRELLEETGLTVGDMQQVGAYTAVDRDPRERVITIAYIALIDEPQPVHGSDDAAKAQWFPLDALPKLAFDHAEILNDAFKLCNLGHQ